MILRHPAALRTIFLSPSELSLGEAYLNDEFDNEGDIESAIALGDHLVQRPRGISRRLRLARDLLALPSSRKRPAMLRPLERLRGSRHSLDRDREAVTYHYHVSNDFCSHRLDERSRQAGLSDRCPVEVRDSREADEPGGYDKLVSVGMFEHVGESRLAEYFRHAFGLLRPVGAPWCGKGKGTRMDEQVRELIAIGASVGAHCQPCLVYHMGKARELGIDEGRIRAAIETGHMVEKGAMGAMRKFTTDLLSSRLEVETGDGA